MPFPSWYLGFVAPDYMDVWLETVDVTDSQLYRLRVFRPKWNSWGHTVESQAAAIARWSLPPKPISRNMRFPMAPGKRRLLSTLPANLQPTAKQLMKDCA